MALTLDDHLVAGTLRSTYRVQGNGTQGDPGGHLKADAHRT